MRSTPAITGFNSGELGPSMEGRTDLKQYATACFALENFIPQVQGPARRRPGTMFVATINELINGHRTLPPSILKGALTEFVRSVTNSFILEWGDHSLRFYQNDAQILLLQPIWNQAVSGTTIEGALTWTNIGFPPWAFAVPSGANQIYLVDPNGNVQTNTNAGSTAALQPVWNPVIGGLTPDGSVIWQNLGQPAWAALTAFATGAVVYTPFGLQQISAGGGGLSGAGVANIPYQVHTPYGYQDLYDANGFFQLVFIQSADVVYITHRSQKFITYKLSHFGPTNWTFMPVPFIGGPFGDTNPGSNPIVFASAQTGNAITLSASSDIFDPLLMGANLQLTQQSISEIRPWEPQILFAKGQRCRYNGVTYECIGGAFESQNPPGQFKSGSTPPTHLTGSAFDGGGGDGVIWLYRDPGYGYVQLIAKGAAPSGSQQVITGITAAKPPVVTVDSIPTGMNNGDLVFITGVIGMDEVNHNFYRVASISGNTFHLQEDTKSGTGAIINVDGTSWDPYVSGGTADNRIYTCTVNVPAAAQASEINRLPATVVGSENATAIWAVAAWNNRDGYPSAVAFFRGRLALARAGRVDISVSQDFENFSAQTPNALITDDMAIAITLPIQDPINWLVEGRILVAGTEAAIHGIQEINQSAALGPTNVATKLELKQGARAVRPTIVGLSLLWAVTSGLKVRSMAYQFFYDNYKSDDRTSDNDTISQTGIVALAFQQEPDTIVWMLRADGLLIGLVFNEEQEVIAWCRHPMTNGIVESIACIPKADGSQDELWMIVNRTIAGVTQRSVEVMQPHFLTGDEVATDAFYVDCGMTYNGAPTSTISGLKYLTGQTVRVLADGSAHPDCVVDINGNITLNRAASVVQVGLPIVAKLTTMPLEFATQGGTAQGKIKRVTSTIIRFLNTLGGKLGNDDDNNFEICEFRRPQDPMNQPLPIFNGLYPRDGYDFNWPEGYEQEGKLTYRNDTPFPATVVAIYPEVTSAD